MPNRKRKYDFETKVKVPDIEEISRVAEDFSDPTIAKGGGTNRSEPLSKLGKVAKLDSKLTEAQKQMQLLAREVIKQEKSKQSEDSDADSKESDQDDALEESSDTAAVQYESSVDDVETDDSNLSECAKNLVVQGEDE